MIDYGINMAKETAQGQHDRWPILDTLPDHEPTLEEVTARRQEQALAMLKFSQSDDPFLRRFGNRMLSYDTEFQQRMAAIHQQMIVDEISPLYKFRRMYEEGQITDEDMQVLDEAAARGSSYNSSHFDGDHSAAADKDKLFRRAIIPAYLTFRDPDLVARTVDLVIQHGESHQYKPPFDIVSLAEKLNEELPEYPEDDPQLAADLMPGVISTIAEALQGPQRSYKFTIEHGLAKAEYVYRDNNTFVAVEAFFSA